TCSEMSRRVVCAISITRPLRMYRLNPGSSTTTWYDPGGRSGSVYAPCWLVTADSVTPVATCVTVTVAPGTTAPVASLTVPVSVPRIVWAHADASARTIDAARRMTEASHRTCGVDIRASIAA